MSCPVPLKTRPTRCAKRKFLALPVVASYCGGIPTLLTDGLTGYFYRYEEYEQLAQTVMRLFGQESDIGLSAAEMEVAGKRHDREKNALRLAEIYNDIMQH